MKFVVIGAGKLGETLCAQLVQEGHDVTVIDNKPAAIQKVLNEQDLMCIEGNGATADLQLEAGIKKADLLIATTAHDELNMLCCMVAKKLANVRSISRVRNPEYYNQMDLIKNDIGLAMVINPELSAAGEIARVLIFPAAAKVEVFGKGKVEVVENRLAEDSPLVGLSLAEIYKKLKLQFLICAVQRDQEIFIPSGDFVLQANDKINVAASHNDLERFFKQNGSLKLKVRNVMIVGGGKIGFYLARQLCDLGMRVKVIEKDYARCTKLCDMLPKAVIINGDGTDQELLIDEGINEVDGFVTLSSIDEENIIMSLFAKNNTKAKIVTKVNRDTYSEMASMLGLDTLISPKRLANGMILSYVRSLENASSESRIESLYNIIGNRVEAIEFNVNEKITGITGTPLRELKLKKDMLICAIIRKRQVLIPNGNDKIDPGDSVIIITKEHHFSELKDILE